MVPLIEERRAEIAALCRRYHVRRLDVFGSAPRGTDFDAARSDVDVLMDFDSAAGIPDLDRYFGLKDALAALLGRPVDLVMAGSVRNPFIRAAIDRNRETLFAA
jgi:predicted nucleotidyltransferase